MTLEGLLSRFADYGSLTAICTDRSSYSYTDLLESVRSKAAKMAYSPSSVVGLIGDFNFEDISTLLALWSRGCIVVPLLTGSNERLEIAQIQDLIGTRARTGDPLEFIDWSSPARGEVDATNVGDGGGSSSHPIYKQLEGSPGLVLFTSGSSGTPKAAVHDMNRWFKKLARPGRQSRTVAFLSFDHVGGLNTLLYALANGGSVVCLPSRSPDAVCRSIEVHEAEVLPTTPTLLRLLLLSQAFENYNLSSLKLITYGSEPMPESTLALLRGALPQVDFLQQYGMSELGVLRSRSKPDGSTWFRIGGPEFGIRIVDGLLEIKAETAMLGYLNAPSPFTSDGWLMTGDEVEQDGEYVRVLGRRSETINVGGEKVHPTEVESALEALHGVVQAIVRGEPSPITGQIVVAQVRLSTNETLENFRSRMRAELKSKLPRFAIPQKVEGLTREVGDRQKKIRAA